MRDEVTVVEIDGVARDEELLGRHVDCLNLARFARDADRHIVLHVERHVGAVLVGVARHHGLGLRHDLDVRVVQQKHHLRLAQAEILLLVNFIDFLVEELDHASAEEQSILEEGVQQLVAVVLVLDDIVDVIGRLLGGLNVLAGARGEANVFVVRREHPHQIRHDGFDGIRQFGGDDRRSTLHLVAKRLAKVEVECAQAVLRVLAVEVVQRVSDLSADDRPKLYVVHLCHLLCLFLSGLLRGSSYRLVALHQDIALAGVDVPRLLLTRRASVGGRHLAHNAAVHSDAALGVSAVSTINHVLLLLERADL